MTVRELARMLGLGLDGLQSAAEVYEEWVRIVSESEEIDMSALAAALGHCKEEAV